MPPRRTTAEFIELAHKAHADDDKYLYDRVTYVNAKTEVTIGCPDHNYFPQLPDVHLRPAGCPKCARKIRSRKELAIWETIVGQRIADLSEDCVELIAGSYKGQNKFANFRCELHDDFPRLVTVALYSKHPCPDCARSAGVSIPHDTESFLELAKTKFGDLGTFLPFEHEGKHTPITFVCSVPGHKPTTILAGSIYRSSGCKDCAYERGNEKRLQALRKQVADSLPSRFQEWLRRATQQHGGKYDYTLVEYVDARIKVKIICPVHGEFPQTPDTHLQAGCRNCADEELKGRYSDQYFSDNPTHKERPAILYYLELEYKNTRFFKIGITTSSVKQRHAMLNTNKKLRYSILAQRETDLYSTFLAEQEIQKQHGDESRVKLPISQNEARRIRIGPSECFKEPLKEELLEKHFLV